MADDKLSQDTQPLKTAGINDELTKEKLSSTLPAWILDWASSEDSNGPKEEPKPIFNDEDADFEAPQLEPHSGWATSETPLPASPQDPIQELDTYLYETRLEEALKLIEHHQNNPEFRIFASKTIRKHLNLKKELAPLWDIYKILNKG